MNDYPIPTIICKVPQSSNTFQAQIQRPGRFFNASQRRAPIGRKKVDIEYTIEQGEVINYTLDGVSINTVTTKIQVSVLTQAPERKQTAQGFHHEANGDFKTVTKFNGYHRRNLRMNQQHCSYSTILKS